MFTKAIGCSYSSPFCEVIVMELSQTKRAIFAREWRVGRREKRRFNNLLSAYTKTKYKTIYDECHQLYNSLNQQHPKKRDLTKTQEFKKWKSNLTSNELSDEDTEQTTTETRTEAVESDEDTEQSTTETRTEAVESGEDTEQSTTETRTEAVESGEDTEQSTTETRTEPPRTDQNILELAAEDLLPLDPQSMDNIDDMINDIIQDLQQDKRLRDIFYYDDDLVQPQYMDEDEGIGLNVSVELEDIIEPLDLEEEGFVF